MQLPIDALLVTTCRISCMIRSGRFADTSIGLPIMQNNKPRNSISYSNAI